MPTPELEAFELSRIYAKGWNAGKVGPLDMCGEALDAFVERANPYAGSAERERWALGFKDGLRRSDDMEGRKPVKHRSQGAGK